MTVYTIPSSFNFAEALVRGLLPEVIRDPLAFSRLRLLLPSRRACRTLRDVFLREADGRVLVLPSFSALGDVDEEDLAFSESVAASEIVARLPPAISPLRRQVLLARLIRAREPGLPLDRAITLAAELARLMNQAQAEMVSFDALKRLVPENFADHWKITLDFLQIVTEAWPKILAAEGALDPIDRRDRLIRLQAAAWAEKPPPDRILIAGTTGSQKAVRELIETVVKLPLGGVVLPGLDCDMPEAEWDALSQHPTHPQAGLQGLLMALDLPRSAIRRWPGCEGMAPVSSDHRALLLARAASSAAPEDHPVRGIDFAAALAGVRQVIAATPQEEATILALALRETLETPGRTAALVTPDRDLARRVAAELARYGVACDDSAGQPLSATIPGIFLRLLAEAARERFAPAPLLALLKHPLTGLGLARPMAQRFIQKLEYFVLRGPRPQPGLKGLQAAAGACKGLPSGFPADLDRLVARLHPWEAAMARPNQGLRDLLCIYIAVAEALCATDRLPGDAVLWAGEAGEAAAVFLAELLENTGDFLLEDPGEFPALLLSFMKPIAVRRVYNHHPRLSILGPLEARLIRSDRVLLAGLNEGTWPAEPPEDPWMSRPMRQQFGLPANERRIGLSAHDFVQTAMAPEVIFSRSERVDGTPTVPSRWLQRLAALLTGQGLALTPSALPDWAAALDQPKAYAPHPPPLPCPPLEDRPRALFVTDIELWRRDPYALYAKRILGLKALEPLDAEPGAAERGQILHEALDRFVRAHPGTIPADGLKILLAIGHEVFESLLTSPSLYAFWWPRFERVAEWFIAEERERRSEILRLATETFGSLTLMGRAGAFTLKAKADRIEDWRDGRYRLIDYKTGTLPSEKEIQTGYAPQLPLEALIAEGGGFEGLPAKPVTELEFWHLSGGATPGKVQPVKMPMAALLLKTREGLAALIDQYDDPTTPYPVAPRPQFAPRFSEYAHLARVAEWSSDPGDVE